MRRTALDLLLCLLIQILVLTGIAGAAHSGGMAAAENYALCGTGGVVDAPNAGDARHCLDCVAAVAGIESGTVMAVPERFEVAAEPPARRGLIERGARSDAPRIRAPPGVSGPDI